MSCTTEYQPERSVKSDKTLVLHIYTNEAHSPGKVRHSGERFSQVYGGMSTVSYKALPLSRTAASQGERDPAAPPAAAVLLRLALYGSRGQRRVISSSKRKVKVPVQMRAARRASPSARGPLPMNNHGFKLEESYLLVPVCR